jgi:integrase
MPARRFPRGITFGPKGWRVSLGAGGAAFRRRFAPTVPYETVLAEYERAKARIAAGTAPVSRGTLKADAVHYLAAFYAGKPAKAYDERARHLRDWIAALGAETWRASITRDDISRVLQGWLAAGLAPATCNKRRTALLSLFHALDGKGAKNPVREVPLLREPPPLPRGLAYPLIEAAFAVMPKNATRAHLRVMAYTGLRPIQIQKLTPDDWDPKEHTLTVQGTQKGHGTKPYTIPLSAQARVAMREYDAADAWGKYDSHATSAMWRAAATRVKLPPGTVPYDLRHSFGTAIYRATGDLRITKELMGHADITMTERYTLAAIPERQHRAMQAFEKAVKPLRAVERKRR